MEYIEKQVDSTLQYHGVIVDVLLDHAELSNGAVVKREVVKHPGGVGILPVDDDGNCYMVRQYRYPAEKQLLEIPAGKLDKGEYHLDCAVRELSEETGFSADSLDYMGYVYTSPGYSDEKLYIYIARGLHSGEQHPDENEFLNVVKVPLEELVDDVMNGRIYDAKTAIAIMQADKLLH